MASLGYRAQLPGSVVRKMVQRQPGVGEAITSGIAQLGGALANVSQSNAETEERIAQSQHRIALLDQQRNRAATVADGMGRMADVELRTTQQLQELRDTMPAGAPEYATKAEEIYRQNWTDFQATLGNDPEVQQHFASIGARWLGRGIQQGRDYERQQRVQQLGDQFQKSLDMQSGALYSEPTVENLEAMLKDFDGAIDMQLVDGSVKQVMRDQVRQKLVPAMFEGTLAGGHFDAVEQAVKSGQFDQWIGGADGKSRWLSRIGAGRDVVARQAEATANEARQSAVDAMDAIDARIQSGETVPQADIERALDVGKAAGVDQARLIKFATAGDRSTRSAYARGLQTRELEGQASALETKRSAGKATDNDLRTLDALNRELDDRADKGAQAVSTLWKGNDGERQVAVQQLHGMPLSERMRVASRVGGTIGVLASLPAKNAQTALRGGAIRRDRPEAFMPLDGDKPKPDMARDAFNRFLGQGVINAMGGDYDKILNTALDLYVGSKADNGDRSAWNEGEFRDAIRIVFGQTLRRDGSKQGGLASVRGRMVELPSGWNGAEFDRTFSRLNFPRAIYADGSAASKADILANYRLVVEKVADDGHVQYRLEDGRGRALRRDDGQTYRVIFNRTPPGGN
ncbi:hypothetical protein [Novosphingobium clariflavum]|uniref:Uncharacterized protein n=1 Tax=Novosphingobium clariflavum TaxID=2029884 RepID=A0ABV6S1W8_9SPHN|nr:hypothetical protein [Novosphingobium clariflavum]